MREAQLTLDAISGTEGEVFTRGGQNMDDVVEQLCRSFGGCTMWKTYGCWFFEGEFIEDASITFRVALGAGDWPAFETLARFLAKGQDTVYLVSPAGEVFILPADQMDMRILEEEEV